MWLSHCHDSSSKKSGDLQRISLILWSNMAFISLCRVPSRWLAAAAAAMQWWGISSRLSVLMSLLLDVLSGMHRPLGMGFTRLPCRPEVCARWASQCTADLRFTAGVWADVVGLRGQLCERGFVRTGVDGSGEGGASNVRLTLAGDGGGISGRSLAAGSGCGHGGSRGWGCDSVSGTGSASLATSLFCCGSFANPSDCSALAGSKIRLVSCSAPCITAESSSSTSNSSWIGFWLPGTRPSTRHEACGDVSKSCRSAVAQGAAAMWWESMEDIRLKIPRLVSGGSWILTLWARLTGSLMAPLWMAALAAAPCAQRDTSPLLLSWEMASRSLGKYGPRPSSEERTEESREGCLWLPFKCFWAAFWMCFLAAWTALAGLICVSLKQKWRVQGEKKRRAILK